MIEMDCNHRMDHISLSPLWYKDDKWLRDDDYDYDRQLKGEEKLHTVEFQ
jgi:hypothetical protein